MTTEREKQSVHEPVKKSKFEHALDEFQSTEQAFQKDIALFSPPNGPLYLLIKKFSKKMFQNAEQKKNLKKLMLLSEKIAEIIPVHRAFLNAYNTNGGFFEGDIEAIKSQFVLLAVELGEYAAVHAAYGEKLVLGKEFNAEFKRVCEKAGLDNSKFEFGITQFLLKPIQHMVRFPLKTEPLVRNVPAEQPQLKDKLQDFLEFSIKCCNRANEAMKNNDKPLLEKDMERIKINFKTQGDQIKKRIQGFNVLPTGWKSNSGVKKALSVATKVAGKIYSLLSGEKKYTVNSEAVSEVRSNPQVAGKVGRHLVSVREKKMQEDLLVFLEKHKAVNAVLSAHDLAPVPAPRHRKNHKTISKGSDSGYSSSTEDDVPLIMNEEREDSSETIKITRV